jgi:membrane associated rhomboid family serine protease
MTAIILENLSEEDLATYSLVLSSSGIPHRSRKGQQGWDILVKDTDYEKAFNTIEEYVGENQSLQAEIKSIYYGEYNRTLTGIWVSAILLLFYIVVAFGNKSEFFIKEYGSSAFHILNGELYRNVTSLMIHANTLHIMGNMVGISIFGSYVCSIMGLGVGWFMILASGIAGNLINALLRVDGHISVGASTSIFGAIGILSAYQFFKKFREREQRVKAFLPLVGGLALLGMLGSGEHSDLMAHLFGFLSGIIAGSMYCVFIKRPVSGKYQTCLIIFVFCITIASWMRAF